MFSSNILVFLCSVEYNFNTNFAGLRNKTSTFFKSELGKSVDLSLCGLA